MFVRAVAFCAAIAPACLVSAALIPSVDGRTVHDTTLRVTWRRLRSIRRAARSVWTAMSVAANSWNDWIMGVVFAILGFSVVAARPAPGWITGLAGIWVFIAPDSSPRWK